MNSDLPAMLVGNIEMRALSEHEWRVRDRSLPEHDATSLLGFIELRGTKFEVTRMGAPLARDRFDTLAAAVDSISRKRYVTT